jgi:PAS domain S-box-containing protein
MAWGLMDETIATEAAGLACSLVERLRGLDLDAQDALAAVRPDGTILFATPEATRRLAGAAHVGIILAADLCAIAAETGAAAGTTRIGPASLSRISDGADTVLLMHFGDPIEDSPPTTDFVDVILQSLVVSAPRAQETAVPETSVAAAAATEAAVSETAVPEAAATVDQATETTDKQKFSDVPVGFEGDAQAASAEPVAVETTIEPPSEESVPRPRHPLRFIWQMDADGRFTLGSDEFTEIIGSRMSIALGRPWREINAELSLDPAGRIARAIATRDTWSNIVISWPVEGTSERLDVEIAGLPAFDRNRTFLGYRGFGVCRDVDRIERVRKMRPLGLFTPPEAPTDTSPLEESPVREAENVVRFPSVAASVDATSDGRPPALSPGEHNAFRELSRQLAARLQLNEPVRDRWAVSAGPKRQPQPDQETHAVNDHALIDQLPIGILVYRYDELVFANRTFLAMTGYADLRALAAAGGLDALFVDTEIASLIDGRAEGRHLLIATRSGSHLPVDGRLHAISWNSEPAFAVVLTNTDTDESAYEAALRRTEGELRDTRRILDAATDAVMVIDCNGCILSSNRGGEVLFDRNRRELEGAEFANLLAPQSRPLLADTLSAARRDPGRAAVTLVALTRSGSEVPVSVAIRRVGEDNNRLAIALRSIAPSAAAEPLGSTAGDKLMALAKLSHDARTPLNSILGFCDIMLAERFGAIGNERYRSYVDHIRLAGTHLLALITDAADLARIEAGSFDLSPSAVNLNEVVSESVLEMQTQANEARVIVRVSLAPAAGRVLADLGAVRQIVGNLLGSALRNSRPGGQVIVSTGVTPARDMVLRLRDNGGGITETAIAAALDAKGPQATTPPWSATGQTLPLTRALAEANQAQLRITSKPKDGALFEVIFTAKAEHGDGIFGHS